MLSLSGFEVVSIVLGVFFSHPTVVYFVLKLYFSCPGIVLKVSLTRCRVVLELSKVVLLVLLVLKLF